MNIDFENIKSYLENKEENIYLKIFYLLDLFLFINEKTEISLLNLIYIT